MAAAGVRGTRLLCHGLGLVLASTMLAPHAAHAQAEAPQRAAVARPSARLVYQRDGGASGCPSDAALREAVAQRLGYALFDRVATAREVRVQITTVGRGLHARLELRDGGELQGVRELRSPTRDCEELASALALAISLAVDPTHLLTAAPAPDAASPPVCPVCPVCADAAAATPPAATEVPAQPEGSTRKSVVPSGDAERASDVELRAELGAGVGAGLLPAVSATLAAGLALRLGHAHVGVEGVAYPGVDAVTSRATGADAITSQALLGRLAACGLWPLERIELGLCALGGLGSLHSEGLSTGVRDSSPVATAGLRALAEVGLASAVDLQLRADLAANLARTTLRLDDVARWTSPLLAGGVSLAASLRF